MRAGHWSDSGAGNAGSNPDKCNRIIMHQAKVSGSCAANNQCITLYSKIWNRFYSVGAQNKGDFLTKSLALIIEV